MTELSFPLLESTESVDDDILISTWRIYNSRPSYLSGMLGNGGSKKKSDSQINCLHSGSSDRRLSGKQDSLYNMWVIKCKNNNDIDICLEKLQLKYSKLHVDLKSIQDFLETPMIIFINNKSEAIETLKNNLRMLKKEGNNGKPFYYEINYGPAIEKWASDVFKKNCVCIGGRFCITNSDSYERVMEWNNLVGCLIRGKPSHLENIWTPQKDVILVGAKGRDGDSQRDTLRKLIEWMSQDPKLVNPPKDEPEQPTSKLTAVSEESHRMIHDIKNASEEQCTCTSAMPEVDSESTFKRTYRSDPLSYPRLMSFLARDKEPNSSYTKGVRKPNASFRKIELKKSDNAKNRRLILNIIEAIGESRV